MSCILYENTIFKKKHSEAFIYFLEEYDKWQELKRKYISGSGEPQ